MARHIGIDIGSSHVRALLLTTGYRRIAIEAVAEVAIDAADSLELAIRACATGMLPHSDGIAVAIEGDSAFVHRMKLPLTARKQLDAVLPFELEAQMPIDMSEVVYDYRVLRSEPTREVIDVIAALARTEQVKERIELVKRALGREPERVGCGSLVLGNLALLTAELRSKSPVALVDLGSRRTEVTVLRDGEPLFVRTLSRGVSGLPESAAALIADLRAEKPDLYVNLTTGTYPSPFFLRHAVSIWRGGEDHDFAGVGSDRQRWITYRDADTYAGIVKKGPLFPLNALMLLSYVALKEGDEVGAMTFGTPGGEQRLFAPRKGSATLNAIMARLHDIEPSIAHSDYQRAARDLMSAHRKRALVIVLTNFRDEDAAELRPALKMLRTRHLVLLASLRERVHRELTEQPLMRQQQAVVIAGAHLFEQSRRDAFRRMVGIDPLAIDVEPSQLGVALVNHYHAVKRARLL